VQKTLETRPKETPPSGQSIEVDYDLPDPPAKVWRALTEPTLLEKWLMKNDIKAEVGHEFTFQAPPIPGQWDGRVNCQVLECESLKKISYSWKGGNAEDTRYGGVLDTIVTWTLEPTASGGTKLHLSHSGFTVQNAFAFENMGKGWRSHLADRMTKAITLA